MEVEGCGVRDEEGVWRFRGVEVRGWVRDGMRGWGAGR